MKKKEIQGGQNNFISKSTKNLLKTFRLFVLPFLCCLFWGLLADFFVKLLFFFSLNRLPLSHSSSFLKGEGCKQLSVLLLVMKQLARHVS